MAHELWTIALAAGAGRRLASVTGGVPKQYYRPEGARSLLEETLARVRPLVAPERTLTVVDAGHRPYVESFDPHSPFGEVVYQPMDRGTAAGVLLPLMKVREAAPDAIVVVTPSDHGVGNDECFRKGISRAIARVRSGGCDIVLFGVEPSAIRADFGWIMPATRGTRATTAFQPVASFVEKPPLHEARQLFSAGAVWNSMVLVASARALFDLYRQHLPFHADVLSAAHMLDAGDRDAFLRDWYPDLPAADFCRDVLTPAASELCLYTWPIEMGWSDLGTPDRLQEWLAVQGRTLMMERPSRAERVA